MFYVVSTCELIFHEHHSRPLDKNSRISLSTNMSHLFSLRNACFSLKSCLAPWFWQDEVRRAVVVARQRSPSMISPPERARPRRAGESYEEKCERRHETREALRRRSHPPSCRRPGRAAEELPQSPRQREFLRRRNLSSTAVGAPGGPRARGDPSPPGLLQVTPAPRAAPFLRCPLQHGGCSPTAAALRPKPKCKVRMHPQKPRISLTLRSQARVNSDASLPVRSFPVFQAKLEPDGVLLPFL